MVNNRTQNIRTLRLVAVGCVYLIVGAGIFHVLEKDRELQVGETLSKKETQMREKYNISSEDMIVLRETLIEFEPYRKAIQWDYIGSLYFSVIVLTTIGQSKLGRIHLPSLYTPLISAMEGKAVLPFAGYGHSVPHTPQGKITCMIYSLLGVPLYLVMFQAMGERINSLARYLMKRLGERIGVNCCAQQASVYPLIPFGLASCILTVMIGTLMFSHFEDWSLLDSSYYCIITLTTIGFGDYVPLLSDRALQNRPSYVAFSLIYILAGLTIIGSFVNLVVLRMMITPAVEDVSREETELVQGRNTGDVQLANVGQGFDHEHVFLPNVNGDVPMAANRTDSVETNYAPRRKAKSLRKSLDDKFMLAFSRNSRTSHHSEGETVTVSGELRKKDRFSRNKLPSTEPAATSSANTGWSSNGEWTIPTRGRTMSYNDLQFFEKELSRGSKWQKQKSEIDDTSSERPCIICQRSCPVCGTLFSYLSENAGGKSRDLTSRRTNNNENNNTASSANTIPFLMSQHSACYPANMVDQRSIVHDNKAFRPETKPHDRSLPSVCSQPNLKVLLEPNLVHRPRNHSLDSGYEGMTTALQDDRISRRHNQYEYRGHTRHKGLRSGDVGQGLEKSDGNLQICWDEDKLRVPSLWSNDGSSSPSEEQDYSRLTTPDDMDSPCSVPINYDTTKKLSKGLFGEQSVSNEVISGRIVSPEIAESGNSSDPVLCELKSPHYRIPPRIVVTDFGGACENVCVTSDGRSPTPEQNSACTPLRQIPERTYHPTINYDIEKQPGEYLTTYLCSAHLQNFERLQERILEACADRTSSAPTNRSESHLDTNPRGISSTTGAISKKEESLSTSCAVITLEDSMSPSGDCSTLNTADLCLTRRTKDVTTKPQSSHENIKTMIVSKNPHWDSTEQSYHFIHTFEGESTRLNLIGNNLGRSKQDKTPFYSPLDHNGECLRRIISPSRRRNSFESDKSHRRKTVSRAVSLPMSRSRFSGDSELVRNKVLRKSNPGMAGNCRNAAGQMSVKSVDDSNRANSQNEAIHHIHHRSDEINYLHQ